MSPFLKKLITDIKKEHYSNFGTFENASLLNVPGHYLRKYGTYFVVAIFVKLGEMHFFGGKFKFLEILAS